MLQLLICSFIHFSLGESKEVINSLFETLLNLSSPIASDGSTTVGLASGYGGVTGAGSN